jgi:predicted MFS family arabinose efflux permease
MGYLRELLGQWRPLLAAMLGLGSGYSLTHYTTSIMAPELINEFHWTPGDFAKVGALSLFTVFVFPIIGRLTDVIGVRRTALIGVLTLPIGYFAITAMDGDLRTYMIIFVLQSFFCVTTTSTVYTRIVVQYIKGARGLALAIVASAPALTGLFGGPLLNDYVDAHGWRDGYLALALFSVLTGAAALLIMPSERKEASTETKPKRRGMLEDLPLIVNNPAFWVMICAALLINLPQVLALTQMKLLLQENGVTGTAVSLTISAFATGVLLGRFASGLALDRFPAHLVAAIGLGAPSIGLFLIASSLDAPQIITASIFMLGLSFGAEGDVIAYLVVKHFGVKIYSTVLGFMTLAMSSSTAMGAWIVGMALDLTGGYTAFVTGCAFAVLIGGALFLLLRNPKGEAAGA